MPGATRARSRGSKVPGPVRLVIRAKAALERTSCGSRSRSHRLCMDVVMGAKVARRSLTATIVLAAATIGASVFHSNRVVAVVVVVVIVVDVVVLPLLRCLWYFFVVLPPGLRFRLVCGTWSCIVFGVISLEAVMVVVPVVVVIAGFRVVVVRVRIGVATSILWS